MNHAVALAELVTCIEEANTDALVAPVFVFADLVHDYGTTWSNRDRTCSRDQTEEPEFEILP